MVPYNISYFYGVLIFLLSSISPHSRIMVHRSNTSTSEYVSERIFILPFYVMVFPGGRRRERSPHPSENRRTLDLMRFAGTLHFIFRYQKKSILLCFLFDALAEKLIRAQFFECLREKNVSKI